MRDRLHAVLDTALLRSPFAGGAGAPAGGWAPAVDVVETDAAYVLSVEIPGVAREDVELSADGGPARGLRRAAPIRPTAASP